MLCALKYFKVKLAKIIQPSEITRKLKGRTSKILPVNLSYLQDILQGKNL